MVNDEMLNYILYPTWNIIINTFKIVKPKMCTGQMLTSLKTLERNTTKSNCHIFIKTQYTA